MKPVKMVLFVGSIAAVIAGFANPAFSDSKTIGTWVVNTEADRFSEDKPKVIAITKGAGAYFLAVRCLNGELSFAMMGRKLKEGDVFFVKFRVDKQPIIDTEAVAISSAVLEMTATKEMMVQLTAGKEYAFRVTGTASEDFLFRAGRGSAQAINEVLKACPLD